MVKPVPRRSLILSVAILLLTATHGSVVRSQTPAQTGVSYLAIDLASGRTIAAEQAERLDRATAPGSLIKIATLAAALEAGVIGPRSGLLCAHETRVAGQTLTCAHPDLQRPLQPAEALAHSCNTFFTTIAARTPRSVFDRVLTDLGLPTTDPAVPLPAAAVGLEGIRIAPRRFIDALSRIAREPNTLPWKATTLTTVREGLAGAARYGTARALGDRGVSALAKTGTTVAGGLAQGFVVGVTPAVSPKTGFVMATSGGAGLDAAALVAERLTAAPQTSTIRIGVTRPDGRHEIRQMPFDDYVAGVVAGEAEAGSTTQALEALAITVRTFAEANRGRHQDEGFDLCDLTHCQVLRTATAATRRAAQATSGQVLRDGRALARVFYSASCGGHTETPSRVWNGASDVAYLPSAPDRACDGRPAWTSAVTVAQLQRALATGRFRGTLLREMTVLSRTPSGRAEWLRLDGLVPDRISGDDLRTLVGRELGWNVLKSTLFDVRRSGTGFVFTGRGAGHGVGLCVLGSAAMARDGASVPAILAAYFPGLTIGRLESPGNAPRPAVRIVLPPSQLAEEARLRDEIGTKLQALSASLGVGAPSSLVVRFHPTVENYERESGRRWFTAASTRGTTIDLLPLGVLRQRGILDSTLAHELVHVLTESELKERPLWVREGIAAYYAGERQSGPDSTCPADRELSAPPSADALRRALTRATACVALEFRRGTPWRELR